MGKFTCSLVVLAVLGLSLMPTSASADGTVSVYFDQLGTERSAVSPGVGTVSVLYVYGEDFSAEFVSGLQYAIDYGPDLTFIADVGLPPVSIGTSATGISIGFGGVPRPGVRFLAHLVLVQWNNDCSASLNNEIIVGPHPLFADPTPLATTSPTQAVVPTQGGVSLTCAGLDPLATLDALTEQIRDIVDNNSGTKLADKLEDVLHNLETAQEELDKDPPDNQAAVGVMEGAAGDL
ncbi:MAG: hypothetical protein KAT30_08850, partial [Candidatus Krumholzibacteria bacterium]|nr:hypothetical protein [Candidatus Krumholzibacteria bacterium]